MGIDSKRKRMNRIFTGFLVILIFSVEIAYGQEHSGDKELSFEIDKDYLVLPVAKFGKLQNATIEIDGKWFDAFEIKIPDGKADYHTFIDITQYKGKQMVIKFQEPRKEILENLNNICLSNTVPGEDSLYQETLRPRFHFSSPGNWLNDPNGLFYLDGTYHMYYQYNPYGWHWGNMHWGHALSKDLIHWEIKPIAIFPVGENAPWTGSAVVDRKNTSGLKRGNSPPVLAIYARKGTGTVIEYSNDGGFTFNEYDDNPVMGGVGDPNVVWYEPGQHWVMVHRHWVDGQEGIAFYTSRNLKKWTYQSYTGWFHTCPMLFPLPVQGTGDLKWVLHDGHGDYMIGDFDGKKFSPDTEKIIFSRGFAYMASQTFNNIPESDGRRIRMAWAFNSFAPNMPFNQCLTIPTELAIRKTAEGLRLCPTPIKELELLYDDKLAENNISVKKFNTLAHDYHATEYRLKLKITNLSKPFSIRLNGLKILLDPAAESISCLGNLNSIEHFAKTDHRWQAFNKEGAVTGSLNTQGEIVLDILVDRLIVEIFANNGEVYMPVSQFIYPDPVVGERGFGDDGNQHVSFFTPEKGIKIETQDEHVKIVSFELNSMKSMWGK